MVVDGCFPTRIAKIFSAGRKNPIRTIFCRQIGRKTTSSCSRPAEKKGSTATADGTFPQKNAVRVL